MHIPPAPPRPPLPTPLSSSPTLTCTPLTLSCPPWHAREYARSAAAPTRLPTSTVARACTGPSCRLARKRVFSLTARTLARTPSLARVRSPSPSSLTLPRTPYLRVRARHPPSCARSSSSVAHPPRFLRAPHAVSPTSRLSHLTRAHARPPHATSRTLMTPAGPHPPRSPPPP